MPVEHVVAKRCHCTAGTEGGGMMPDPMPVGTSCRDANGGGEAWGAAGTVVAIALYPDILIGWLIAASAHLLTW
jgi:hypothetical protein